MTAPIFYFDFSSPYSYLAAMRIDDLLPTAEWRPIAFGVVVQRIGKTPWSFGHDKSVTQALIDHRALDRGLPPLRYPEGWPKHTYSVAPLRAALVAGQLGLLKEFSRELFRSAFVEGADLRDLGVIDAAAVRAGLFHDEVVSGIQHADIKAKLRADTEEAIERGVSGVPTVVVGDALFWGDDQLEDAAEAFAAVPD